jgi:hypothetical protein
MAQTHGSQTANNYPHNGQVAYERNDFGVLGPNNRVADFANWSCGTSQRGGVNARGKAGRGGNGCGNVG